MGMLAKERKVATEMWDIKKKINKIRKKPNINLFDYETITQLNRLVDSLIVKRKELNEQLLYNSRRKPNGKI